MAGCDGALLRGVIENMAAAFVISTLDGRIVHASTPFLEGFALAPGGAGPATVADIFHPADAGTGAAAIARLATGAATPGGQAAVSNRAAPGDYRGEHLCRPAGGGPVDAAIFGPGGAETGGAFREAAAPMRAQPVPGEGATGEAPAGGGPAGQPAAGPAFTGPASAGPAPSGLASAGQAPAGQASAAHILAAREAFPQAGSLHPAVPNPPDGGEGSRGKPPCAEGSSAPVAVAVVARLLRDDMDRPVFVLLTLQAATEGPQDRAAPDPGEARWRIALDTARMAVWDHDATTGLTYHSPMWRELRGIPASEPPDDSREGWLAGIHPEDIERVLSDVDRQEQGEPGFEILEYRQRHRDGHYVWLRSQGRPVARDANGRTLRIVGTDSDVTREKELEVALAAERERARAFLAAVADGAICVDVCGRVVMMNRVAEDWTGWSMAKAEGRDLAEVLNLEPEAPLAVLVHSCMAEVETQTLGGDARLGSRNGAMREIEATAVPLCAAPRPGEGAAPARPPGAAPAGMPPGAAGAVLVMKDMTVSRLLVRQLSHEASHDLLTGLLNRPSFEGAIEAAQAACDGGTHAILFMDLIEFKSVNDRLGRAAGDRLLVRVANTIRSCVRRGDVCARYGGDEFAVLLHGCSPEGAHGLRSEIARTIGALDVPGRNEGIAVAIGVGMMDATTGAETALAAAVRSATEARGPRRKRG